MKKNIYYLPEFQSNNPLFYGFNGKLISTETKSISGYKLYIILKNLNDFSKPFTIVAIPELNEVSNFFLVEFKDINSILEYNFQISENNVIFMNKKDIKNFDKLVPLSKGDWNSEGLLFHTLGAFRDIGLISKISTIYYNNLNLYNHFEKDIRYYYGIYGNYNTSLNRIFSDLFFSLNFFGYTITNDLNEENSIKFAEQISNQTLIADCNCNFAFGNLKNSLKKFHKNNYPNRLLNFKILNSKSYKILIDLLHYISTLLNFLGYNINEEDFKIKISKSLKSYQLSRKINEHYCGKLTIQNLLFEASRLSINNTALAAGIIENIEKKIEIYSNHFYGIKELSEYLNFLPTLKIKENEIIIEIFKNLLKTSNNCNRINEKIEGFEKRINFINQNLNYIENLNKSIEEQLIFTNSSINNVLNDHLLTQEKIVNLKNKIFTQKRSHRIISLFFIIILLIIFFKFFKYFKN